jgi:hypothetical protein
MKRAVLYARVSTDAQQKEGTIESQVLELRGQIAAAGDVLVKEYIDAGYSGTLLNRPGLEALRRDVRTSLFDAVSTRIASPGMSVSNDHPRRASEIRQADHHQGQGLRQQSRKQVYGHRARGGRGAGAGQDHRAHAQTRSNWRT